MSEQSTGREKKEGRNEMKHWYAPDWLIAVVGAMLRFVVGGFGVSLPHPMEIRFCGYFWLALLGCTLGLPIVLFGWTIRLIFGKGRAEAMWDTVADWFHYSPVGQFLGKAFLTLVVIAMIGAVLFTIGSLIYEYGWLNVVLVSLGVALFIVLVVGAAIALGKIQDWKYSRTPKSPKANPALMGLWAFPAKFFTVVIWLPKTILLAIWNILAFTGMQIYAGYKGICPIVEIP